MSTEKPAIMEEYDYDTVLNALRVANTVHYVNTELGSSLDCNGHYRAPMPIPFTKPGVIIVQSSYGIPISDLHTPCGTVKVAGGGYVDDRMSDELRKYDFEMRLIRDGFENNVGCFGPWYQIMRVGSIRYEPVEYDQAWAKSATSYDPLGPEGRKISEQVAAAAYKSGIHDDELGLTKLLLQGETVDPNLLLKNNKNKYLHMYMDFYRSDIDRFVEAQKQGSIRWDLWWRLVYSAHLNTVQPLPKRSDS